ncbi:uncharacterized protein LOC130772103 [Actinidia eriantha]|uniref:uncharacterized protein LOC130772103 n=1 Tax=Actinidia eriantha TaxID=165200 RepID=UPI00258AAE75|nr:uncharacterized protein LOC130772103 [Actinidia eriantha]
MATCCFEQSIKDVKARPFDPNDIYQQFEVFPHEAACFSGGMFVAKSIAPDGFPPYFLRRKGWEIYTKTPQTYELGEALGADISLRAHLPEFGFPVSKQESEGIVVGKWYCPFIFVKDGPFRDQMKNSMFYEMTLEQRWENIFTCENNSYGQGNGSSVSLEVEVHREMVTVGGRKAVWDENCDVDGVIWFRGGEVSVGMSFLLVERMK